MNSFLRPVSLLLLAISVALFVSSDLNHSVLTNRAWLYLIDISNGQSDNPASLREERLTVLETLRILEPKDNNVSRLLGYASIGDQDETDAIQYWRDVPGIEVELQKLAENEWNKRSYQQAAAWYARTLMLLSSPSEETLFRCLISSVIASMPLPEICSESSTPIQVLSQTGVQVEGQYLLWLETFEHFDIHSGDQLGLNPTVSPTAGTMWWAGTSVVVVDSQERQSAQLIIRAKASQPHAPFSLIHNATASTVFETSPGEFAEYSVCVDVVKGLNVFGVRFLEDVGDLTIHSIQIVK